LCGVLATAALGAGPAAGAEGRPEVAFRLAEVDLVPEGLAYDPVTKAFFVGSTYKRKIVRLDAAGRVSDFTSEGQDGLRAVLGLRVDAARRRLWAISSHAGRSVPIAGSPRDCIGCSMVLVYDLDTAALVRTWRIENVPAPHFFNDVVVTPSGDVYVTDTVDGAIYAIRGEAGALESFVTLPEGSAPNGIDVSADGQQLVVATADAILIVEIGSRRVTPLAATIDVLPGIDGLYVHRDGLIAIQPFEDRRKVVRYEVRDGRMSGQRVLDSGAPPTEQPTTGVVVGGDFYYIANSQLQRFRQQWQPDDTYDADHLDEIVILRARIG
jgi:DNA-binding beta-propeller fold protein YncE